VEWKQCEGEALVMITVKQDGEEATFPACMFCWQEAIDTKIEIKEVRPITSQDKASQP
jgi:hypothetical protein